MALNQDAWDNFMMTEEEAALAEKEKKAEDEKKAGSEKGKKDKKSKKEADKKDEVKALEFDLDNRKYRTRRLTGSSALSATISFPRKEISSTMWPMPPRAAPTSLSATRRKATPKSFSKG